MGDGSYGSYGDMTTPPPANRISEIKARLDKATPGPWEKRYNCLYGWEIWQPRKPNTDHLVAAIATTRDESLQPLVDGDADLIAHTPDDLRWLIDEVERKDARIKELIQSRCYCCYSVDGDCDPGCSCFSGDRNEGETT